MGALAAADGAARLPELALEPGTLVLADLHLDVSPHGGDHEQLVRWLRSLQGVPRLLVLGDLFDAWVGPAQLRLAPARAVCAELARLAERGVEVEVLHGNRDFLLDDAFEHATRARVHPAGLVGLLPGPRIPRALFVHGDELCTLDRSYQRLKRVLRSRPVAWLAPRLPEAGALWVARRLRSSSVRAVAAKPPAEKEQQPTAALALGRALHCGALVCGHAHRFRDEQLEGGLRWIVLDAFGGPRDLLRVRSDGTLEPLSSHSQAES